MSVPVRVGAPPPAPPPSLCDALRICEEVQHMIDINSDHLQQVRASVKEEQNTAELTKQEIRTLEGKLIKHFSKQLAICSGAASSSSAPLPPEFDQYPSLNQWLRVVGMTPESSKVVENRVGSVEQLKSKTESELHRILLNSRLTVVQRNEDLRRLSKALQSLRKYTDILLQTSRGGKGDDPGKLELHWDSWLSATYSNSATNQSQHNSSSYSPKVDPTPTFSSLTTTFTTYGTPPMSLASSMTSTSVTSSARMTKPDSVASSFSSNSSIASSLPPPSPGLILSPPVVPWVPTSASDRKCTPPPSTPPWSAASLFGVGQKEIKFPTTPPPKHKHSTTSSISKSDYPLTKSKSHECELGNRINSHHSQLSSISGTTNSSSSTTPTSSATVHNDKKSKIPKPLDKNTLLEEGRDHLEPGPSPLTSPSPFDIAYQTTLQVPKSPRTPRGISHAIKHRFKKTLKPGKCDHCQDYMFNGLKCRECKFKCHRDCESKVPNSCGLPDEFVEYVVKTMNKEGSPIMSAMRPNPISFGSFSTNSGSFPSDYNSVGFIKQPNSHAPYPDSSSNTSSCNSSTPSSPAVMVTTHPTPPHSASYYHNKPKFTFPDPPVTVKLQDQPVSLNAMMMNAANPQIKVNNPNPIIDSVKSYDSDKTLSGTSGSSGSASTTAYRLDSQDSTASVDDTSGTWQAGRQTSISLREWDIPYEELIIGDKIGSGRFSTVHQGNWHGDVAIKILKMENIEDEATLEAFRQDVSTFRMTRHENLILFMGACMNPPKLAIVTSLCKGNTLYTLLHLRKDKFPINKLIIIAQQVAQGMGYLHHKGIVHKDLKTKNIFLENGHAIIADFGLVNVARRLCANHEPANKLSIRETISIPKGWLCYLAPEIMRALRVHPTDDVGEDLPFTNSSDVFAFGTVWYELLTGEWPWKHVPPESMIWLVGKGMEPSLANLQASKDVKEILLMCWSYKPEHRPDFTYLSDMLEKIPKKRGLMRSPSHPVHLSRSAESVF